MMYKIKKIIKNLFIFIFLPLYLTRKYKSKTRGVKKFLLMIFLLFFITPFWLLIELAFSLILFFLIIGNIIGSPIDVIGDSMKPTFSLNPRINVFSYPGLFGFRKLSRGDIVTFHNGRTIKDGKETDFIKRVIALPNDKFMIRNGFVYVNGEILKEPYTLKPRSTFGGSEIKDCEQLTIPEKKLIALGDNRKASSDSREIGMVSFDDIYNMLPLKDQGKYKSKWRDTGRDQEAVNSTVFNSGKFIDLLNIKRQQQGVSSLKLSDKLSKSTNLRAEAMLKYDDLTWESKKSNYPMNRSMADAGYYNIVYGEYPVIGYYDESEMISFMNENISLSKFLLDGKYQDVGVSSFIGELNSCPTQIIVLQLGGYVPPNYSISDIESWKTTLDQLKAIQSSWQSGLNQSTEERRRDLQRINDIINIRISSITSIVATMESNKWLSKEQNNYTSQDRALFNEQEGLASKLNKR